MDGKTKEEKVHHVFEKVYDNYDKMNSIISFNRHLSWRKDVMRRMNVIPGQHILDLCTGTGDWALALADHTTETGSVIGLDFSENMLKVAKDKSKHIPDHELSFIHGNAMSLPFEDNTFDMVTIGFGLRNVPDYDQVIQEMYRVVKPGGKVVCLETSQPTLFGFKQLYFFYFTYIMPLFGKVFAKSYDEYAWLNESTKNFPNKETLKNMFLNAGFYKVDVKSYDLGVAAMHMAHKRNET
ncbi:MAG TPA: demethylmenaquinone methyltransferase [Pseudogracilibacillus sp.]|nr:demethylmenaquinone methyltransferase [Pseudogracilibacillus sp.]